MPLAFMSAMTARADDSIPTWYMVPLPSSIGCDSRSVMRSAAPTVPRIDTTTSSPSTTTKYGFRWVPSSYDAYITSVFRTFIMSRSIS